MQAVQSQLSRDQAKQTQACPMRPRYGQCLYKWKISGDFEQEGIDLLGWKCLYVLPLSYNVTFEMKCQFLFSVWQL